ncbi:TWiK family of potassium channels protein 7-like [Artemia franciscana]|uniref:TWiK family of potassium channels protein 7-like n=1 Tax=Artemia franciscana TaxID=6661 RepID=UPI0032DADF58
MCNVKCTTNVWSIVFKVLSSNFGLTAAILIYLVVGAAIFRKLDKNEKDESAAAIKNIREKCIQELWDFTESLNVLYKENWTRVVEESLKKFESNIITSAIMHSYEGPNKGDKNIDFGESLLFAASLVTTIGNMSSIPSSSSSKIIIILYSTFGIPLALLFLTKNGIFLADVMRKLFYELCCCQLCTGNRKIDQKNELEEKLEENNVLHNVSFISKQLYADKDLDKKDDEVTEDYKNNSIKACSQKGNGSNEQGKVGKENNTFVTSKVPDSFEMVEHTLTEGKKKFEQLKFKSDFQNDYSCNEPYLKVQDMHEFHFQPTLNSTEAILEESRTKRIELEQQKCPVSVNNIAGFERTSPISLLHKEENVSLQCSASVSSLTKISFNSPNVSHETKRPSTDQSRRKNYEMKSPLDMNSTELLLKTRDLSDLSHFTRINSFKDRQDDEKVVVRKSPSYHGKQNVENFHKFPVSLILSIIILYIILGGFVLSEYEGWTFSEGAYFSFMALLTIGYTEPGMVGRNNKGKESPIIVCFYLTLGLTVVTMCLNLVQVRTKAQY